MMLLKLATTELWNSGKTNNETYYCHGNNFAFRSGWCSIAVLIFCPNDTSITPNDLVRRRRAIWALRAFQVGLSASPHLAENGDIWFIAERD